MQWTIRELANYQIGYNERKESESEMFMMLARQVAYSAAFGHLKKNTSIDSFWPLGGKVKVARIDELLNKGDKRFPKHI
jgi:hypothetical protein